MLLFNLPRAVAGTFIKIKSLKGVKQKHAYPTDEQSEAWNTQLLLQHFGALSLHEVQRQLTPKASEC